MDFKKFISTPKGRVRSLTGPALFYLENVRLGGLMNREISRNGKGALISRGGVARNR